jgi:prophage regulatory protein
LPIWFGQLPQLAASNFDITSFETTATKVVKGWIAMAIWRIETCKAESGYRSNASIYNLIRDGLWTKPVLIGQRSVGWPDYEVRAVCAARISGKTETQIRELVKVLHTNRDDLSSL